MKWPWSRDTARRGDSRRGDEPTLRPLTRGELDGLARALNMTVDDLREMGRRYRRMATGK